MSGHPTGHRTKRCEVEARDVPHILCFVRVSVEQGEEVLPDLDDREEAVVRHDHLVRPPLQGVVYHEPRVVLGGVGLVPDWDQRLTEANAARICKQFKDENVEVTRDYSLILV